ncbi:MAG: hypothetical protein Kow0092_19550 [Deferrisomatales bacterium]
MPTVEQVLGLALLGGVLALDRTAFLQAMISRPLVGSTAAGHLLGDPAMGLTCGLLLELLWLLDLPVGASVPADEALAGVLAPVFALASPAGWAPEARAAAGVLAAVPFGLLGRRVDVAVRRWNDALVQTARRKAAGGLAPGLGRCQAIGAARFFGFGAALSGAGAWAGSWAMARWARGLPAEASWALEITEALLPLVGAAGALAAWRGIGARRLFTWGVAAGWGMSAAGAPGSPGGGRLWGG